MANKQLINGKVYDWSSVTITASGMENMEPMSGKGTWQNGGSLEAELWMRKG